MRGGGAESEGEGERESQADSTPSAEPDVGLYLTTLRPRLEPKPRVECLTNYATQVPQDAVIFD